MKSTGITKENLDRNNAKSSSSSASHHSNNSLFLPNLSLHESLGSSMGNTTISTVFSSADSSSISKIPEEMAHPMSGGAGYEDPLDRNGDEDSIDAALLNMTYFGEHGMLGGGGAYPPSMSMGFSDYPSHRRHPSEAPANAMKKPKSITAESSSIAMGNMKTGSEHNSDNYSSGDMSENDDEKEKYKVR